MKVRLWLSAAIAFLGVACESTPVTPASTAGTGSAQSGTTGAATAGSSTPSAGTTASAAGTGAPTAGTAAGGAMCGTKMCPNLQLIAAWSSTAPVGCCFNAAESTCGAIVNGTCTGPLPPAPKCMVAFGTVSSCCIAATNTCGVDASAYGKGCLDVSESMGGLKMLCDGTSIKPGQGGTGGGSAAGTGAAGSSAGGANGSAGRAAAGSGGAAHAGAGGAH